MNQAYNHDVDLIFIRDGRDRIEMEIFHGRFHFRLKKIEFW